MKKYKHLYTNEFQNVNLDNPLSEYPFPNFKRESYYSLNGKWQYKITKDCKDLSNITNEIIVPYPIESILSQVNKTLKKNEYIIYKKTFTLNKDFIKQNTFIHFLGVDQEFEIIINNNKLDKIIPLNLPSKIDISKYIKEENDLIVIIKDNLDYRLPKGKQSKKPKGIFYTPFSGIYFPVFIESVDNDYIDNITINTNLDTLNLSINSTSDYYKISIRENNNIIKQIETNNKDIQVKIDNPINWDTSNPFLYYLEIETKTDKIQSYFALREFKLLNNKFYLNNKEIFLNGVLSQGYYPEGIITPPTYDLLEYDVKTMKNLGFNTLREHIKIELPYFYYLCDKYGMLVIQDFLNTGKYSFLSQTVLPTIEFQKRNDKHMNKNKTQRENFIRCADKLINYLNNHPSVIAYTIFNEGWGQFTSDDVYTLFKTKYPNLIFDTTSGWFIQHKSDLNSYHWNFKNLKKLKNTPSVFLSEFGALCHKVKNHSYSDKKVFGYTYFDSIDDLEKAYINLFENKIIPYKHNLNGCIYTQLSDIEEEDNGILTFDRKHLKINKDIIISLNNKLNEKN